MLQTAERQAFGGESPYAVRKAYASEAADLPGRAGCCAARGLLCNTPPPREVKTLRFSPPLIFF